MALKIGQDAPSWKGINQHGESISSEGLMGKKTILFFYPKASTPGCTVEACNFRDHYEDLVDKGFEVVGVSADSVNRQLNFSAKQKLNFSLIADEEKMIITAFEAWGNKKFMGKQYDGIFRHTYVIDELGKIEQVLEKVKTKEATEQILSLY
ncbi:MAG TPA: thioredoxin-dependent thiol peroxidase [Cryomorphaceae bacterium]|nr:thioredoxin-dependent thiol peroxidase [Cryomorphaceae bacterium]HCY25086.1 thioredoxin-dependent thiol peroxidase [Cryomorphaceae bacterium]|tara:strand:+ start:4485 stop:4940 length:456 start_codon:yes stop_codon:yes gene_type:complete